jgi:hypothetical protein
MVKFRHSRLAPRKPWLTTSQTSILTLFVTFTLLILILLTLRIPKLNHINSISHNALRFNFSSTLLFSVLFFSLYDDLSFSSIFYAEVKTEMKTMTISVGFKSYRGSLEHFYIIIFWSVSCFPSCLLLLIPIIC